MLNYYARRSSCDGFEEIAPPENIDGVWLHGTNVTDKDIEIAVKRFKLDINIVRDVFDSGELPRIEYDDTGALYVFLRVAWRGKDSEVKTAPLLAIASKNSYITLSQAKICQPSEITNKHPHTNPDDVEFLILSTLSSVVSGYGELINRTADTVRTIKYRLRKREVTNEDFYKFITIEENLATYLYNLTAMRSVADRLRDDSRTLQADHHLEALDDIILHIRQLRANVDSLSHTVTSLYNVYSTVANNILNQRMKMLTIITLVVTVPNVFYGMYGMNIALPFAHEPWAYWFVVGFTLLVMILIVILVRRSKLL